MKTRLRTKEMDHPGNQLELLVLGQFVNSIDAGFQSDLAIARLKHNAPAIQRLNARARAQRERKISQSWRLDETDTEARYQLCLLPGPPVSEPKIR
jgi:hypothetical protein